MTDTPKDPRCPRCGGRMITVEGHYVCAEFWGYKEEMAQRKPQSQDYLNKVKTDDQNSA